MPPDVDRIALIGVLGGRLGQAVPVDPRVELALFLAFDRAVVAKRMLETRWSVCLCRSSVLLVALPIRRILRS
jgi:hypothetical protein